MTTYESVITNQFAGEVHEMLKTASYKQIYEKQYSEAIQLYEEVLNKAENEPSLYDLTVSDIFIIKYAVCSCFLNKKSDFNNAYRIIHSISSFGSVFPALHYTHAKLLYSESHYYRALEIIQIGIDAANKLQEPMNAKWPGTNIPILESNIELLLIKFESLQQNCSKMLKCEKTFQFRTENAKLLDESLPIKQEFFDSNSEEQSGEKCMNTSGNRLTNLEIFSQSSNSSVSNLKIDAPEFFPTGSIKTSDFNDDVPTKSEKFNVSEGHSILAESAINSNENKEFEDKVILLLQDIRSRIRAGFSNVNQKQIELLFINEDKVNTLQKQFADEIDKQKCKTEEEKIKNAKMETKLKNISNCLINATSENEKEIKRNILLKGCLEKQCEAMYDFQKRLLCEVEMKCSYIKGKMNQIAPFITPCSIPNYEEFHNNLHLWNEYEIKVKKHSAELDKYFAMAVNNINMDKFESLTFPKDFPFVEPKCVLNEAFLYLLHSYNSLHHQKNVSQNPNPPAYLQNSYPQGNYPPNSYTPNSNYPPRIMPQLQYQYRNVQYYPPPPHQHPVVMQTPPVYYTKPNAAPAYPSNNADTGTKPSSIPASETVAHVNLVNQSPKRQYYGNSENASKLKQKDDIKESIHRLKELIIETKMDEKDSDNSVKAINQTLIEESLEEVGGSVNELPKTRSKSSEQYSEEYQFQEDIIEMFKYKDPTKSPHKESVDDKTNINDAVTHTSSDLQTSINEMISSNRDSIIDELNNLPSPISPQIGANISYSAHNILEQNISLETCSKNTSEIVSPKETISCSLSKETNPKQKVRNSAFVPYEGSNSPPSIGHPKKGELKFYNPALSVEEQIENLSEEVKAMGGIKFLHLFIYLWQNLPLVSEENLLKAFQAVKKTVGKLSGMRKESILISVKRMLESGIKESESEGDMHYML